MTRTMLLWFGAATCALAVGCGGAVDPQSEEATSSTSSAQTACDANGVCTYTGALKQVDVLTGAVSIITPGGKTVTLSHTAMTVHVGVVPGPMRGVGVVPGPMHWLWELWNAAVANHEAAVQFLILLDDLSLHHGRVTLTTTDGATIGSVQPGP